MDRDSPIYVAGHRSLVGSAIGRSLVCAGYKNLLTRTHKDLWRCREFFLILTWRDVTVLTANFIGVRHLSPL